MRRASSDSLFEDSRIFCQASSKCCLAMDPIFIERLASVVVALAAAMLDLWYSVSKGIPYLLECLVKQPHDMGRRSVTRANKCNVNIII